MRKKYEIPELAILLFEEKDVVTASVLNDGGYNGGIKDDDAVDWGDIF